MWVTPSELSTSSDFDAWKGPSRRPGMISWHSRRISYLIMERIHSCGARAWWRIPPFHISWALDQVFERFICQWKHTTTVWRSWHIGWKWHEWVLARHKPEIKNKLLLKTPRVYSVMFGSNTSHSHLSFVLQPRLIRSTRKSYLCMVVHFAHYISFSSYSFT